MLSSKARCRFDFARYGLVSRRVRQVLISIVISVKKNKNNVKHETMVTAASSDVGSRG